MFECLAFSYQAVLSIIDGVKKFFLIYYQITKLLLFFHDIHNIGRLIIFSPQALIEKSDKSSKKERGKQMTKLLMKMKNKKGFTLIELIVVIAILGILAAILIPQFSGMQANANQGAVRTNLRNLQTAAQAVATETNVAVTTINADDVTDPVGVALGSWPTGPGGTTYQVVNGVATATIGAGVPYPAGGITTFNGTTFG